MYSPTATSAICDSATSAPALPLNDMSHGDGAMPMTYDHLLVHGKQYLVDDGMGTQQVKNYLSALRQWITAHGFSTEKIVSEEFGGEFNRYFERFCDIIADQVGARTQRDRQEQVIRWHRIVQALRIRDTLPTLFAEALKHCITASSLSFRQIARDSALTVSTLYNWANGTAQPKGQAVNQLSKLEHALNLPRGTLVTRLPLARQTRYVRGVEKRNTSTSFTKIRSAQIARTGNYAVEFTTKLERQWDDLLRMKTDPMREEARARNTWRVKPIDRVGMNIKPWMVTDGQICTTAAVHWGNFASYLGWLALPAPEGAEMAKDEIQTLAWLADPDLVTRYARWRISLSGGKFHNGVSVFLQLVESYLRPNTGFVWLRTDLRETVERLRLLTGGQAVDPTSKSAQWQRHCEVARSKIRGFRERAEDTMGIKLSRDPKERIAVILHNEHPLRMLVDFVETLERSAPPPAHHRDYCAWIRDVLMCRLFISNPIRVGQYATMTYRPDGTGNIVRVGPGIYRMKFSASDFKNEKGAAREPYDVAVDPSAAKWIDRYLTEARPYMLDADSTDRLLLPMVAGPRKKHDHLKKFGLRENSGWTGAGILTRLKVLTSTYIPDCPGFGPHSFRHIIATDHLRRHPGDYLMVAKLLHDKLETVLKNYAHLSVADGLRVLSAGIQEAGEQLAAQRGAAQR